jgi:hypothetical protein
VSTPVPAAGDPAPLSFETGDVLRRVAEHGDLFADVLTVSQRLELPSR